SDGSRNHRVVAPGEIVLGGLPQEPTAAIRELDYARDGRGRAGRRNRCLAGIPRPSRPLLLELGSVGPIVPMGVSMAPRVPRAVPQGRPASRGTVIVSPGHAYNTDRRARRRERGEARRAL